MQIEFSPRIARRALRLVLISLWMSLPTLWVSSASAQQPLYLEDFSQAAPQGFGSVDNSMARASMWWNGKLYVGTSRSHGCSQAAILRIYNPTRPYPPADASIVCTPSPEDLPLQAEIWRWTPDGGEGSWDLAYMSPNSVSIPGTTKFTAREIGFRDMEVFTEADGTEALYATGISARTFIGATLQNGSPVPGLPPPTLLRSTDGENWAPVPQDPGTTLGDLSIIDVGVEGDPTAPGPTILVASFNRIAAFNNKLYLIIGGDFGHGVLYEATNPEQGNDAFHRVSPRGMSFTYMEEFQNRLYLGQGAQPVTTNPPYKVVKMDTTSPDPVDGSYDFPVIVDGTRLPALYTAGSPKSVATMHVVHDAVNGDFLYVATNQPVDLLRINPNDSWELIMGQSRQVQQGGGLVWEYPRTGIGDSFDWFFNIHIHRMQDHNGFLYTASADSSNGFPLNGNTEYNSLFNSRYGFDVHRTGDGWHYYPITLQGFQDKDPGGANSWFNFTGRVMNSTPHGLFIGTGNNQYGAQIWRATPGPVVVAPPSNLEAESVFGTGVVLSWDPSPTAVRYRIFKAVHASWLEFTFPPGGPTQSWPILAGGKNYPRPFTEIATVNAPLTTYIDAAPLGTWSHYYVIAEDAAAAQSNHSNLVRAPSLGSSATMASLKGVFTEWKDRGELSLARYNQLATTLNLAKLYAVGGNYVQAKAVMVALKATMQAQTPPNLVLWRKADVQVLLDKYIRRVDLVSKGQLSAWLL